MPLTCAVWCDISVRMGDGSMKDPLIWLLEILPVPAMVSRNESRSMEDAMSKNAMKQAALTAALLLASCASAAPADARLARIEHIVVIYPENRSFDNLYGLFPGANGIARATPESTTQLDRDGKPLPVLPPVWKAGKPDPAFPINLPNKPFRIDAPPINLPLSTPTR